MLLEIKMDFFNPPSREYFKIGHNIYNSFLIEIPSGEKRMKTI